MKMIKILSLTTLLMTSHALAAVDNALVERIHSHPLVSEAPIVNKGVKVAVIDSGFDTKHSLFRGRLGLGYNARDNNFNVGYSQTINLTALDNAASANMHGTHVAGIVAQLSPHATIIPFKIGASHIPVVAETKAVKEVLKRPDIQIVNISMHVYRDVVSDPSLYTAIRQAAKSGKLIVVSAGNEHEEYKSDNITSKLIQLAQDPEVQRRIIIVGASEKKMDQETMVDWSGKAYEAYPFFVTAPGVNVLSSVPTASGMDYARMSGTSMAAPVVSGILSHIMAISGCNGDEARDFLIQGCIKRVGDRELDKEIYGQGLVSFENSVFMALQKKQKKVLEEYLEKQIALIHKETRHILDQTETNHRPQAPKVQKNEATPVLSEENKSNRKMIHETYNFSPRKQSGFTPVKSHERGNVKNLIKKFQQS